MTDEQLSEILAYPRVRAFIARVAREEARALVAQLVEEELRRLRIPVVRAKRPKPAREVPPGWETYGEAAARHQLKPQTIRLAVCKYGVNGGRGLVEMASMDAWVATRRTKKRKP